MKLSGNAGSNPPSDWLEGFVIVGEIQKPHGVKGEAKVRPETHDLDRYQDLAEIWLGNPKTGEIIEAFVESARPQGEGWLLKFEDINTPEQLREYQFWVVLIDEEDRLELEEGQYYLSDLAGLKVLDSTGAERGKVIEVHDYPSVNVFELKIKGKTVMAPWVEGCIGDIDLENGTVQVDFEFLKDTYDFL